VNESQAPSGSPDIASRLSRAREALALSVEHAAEKLHCDPKVIVALEAGRFDELGAAVFVRGHLRRYGDLLGMSGAALADEWSSLGGQTLAGPDLTRIPQAPRRRDPNTLRRIAIAVGAAVLLAIAAWWILAGRDGRSPLAPFSGSPSPGASGAASEAAEPLRPAAPAATAPRSALAAASAAPFVAPAATATPAPTPRPATPDPATVSLRLASTADSWIEVVDAAGRPLYRETLRPGLSADVSGRAPMRVRVGNQGATTLLVEGRVRDLPPRALRGGGVAVVVVGRDGAVTPAPRD
jgi:cytoskeleton protein RodZ